MEGNQRESWIDICKGIAIILVVIGHVNSSYHNSGINDYAVMNKLGTIVYSFHMPLFFMVSGLLFGKGKRQPLGIEIIKRCISYGIPYLIFSVVLVGGAKILLAPYVNQQTSFADLLKF